MLPTGAEPLVPCLEAGCDEPRVVNSSGRVYTRCLAHERTTRNAKRARVRSDPEAIAARVETIARDAGLRGRKPRILVPRSVNLGMRRFVASAAGEATDRVNREVRMFVLAADNEAYDRIERERREREAAEVRVTDAERTLLRVPATFIVTRRA